jgi:hypothetical protein
MRRASAVHDWPQGAARKGTGGLLGLAKAALRASTPLLGDAGAIAERGSI